MSFTAIEATAPTPVKTQATTAFNSTNDVIASNNFSSSSPTGGSKQNCGPPISALASADAKNSKTPVTSKKENSETKDAKNGGGKIRWKKAVNILKWGKQVQKVRFIINPELHTDLANVPIELEECTVEESIIHYIDPETKERMSFCTKERYIWPFLNSSSWTEFIRITEGTLQASLIECFNELVEEGKVDMYRSLEYTYSSRHMKSFATRRGTLACVKMWHEKEKTEVNCFRLTTDYYYQASTDIHSLNTTLSKLSRETSDFIGGSYYNDFELSPSFSRSDWNNNKNQTYGLDGTSPISENKDIEMSELTAKFSFDTNASSLDRNSLQTNSDKTLSQNNGTATNQMPENDNFGLSHQKIENSLEQIWSSTKGNIFENNNDEIVCGNDDISIHSKMRNDDIRVNQSAENSFEPSANSPNDLQATIEEVAYESYTTDMSQTVENGFDPVVSNSENEYTRMTLFMENYEKEKSLSPVNDEDSKEKKISGEGLKDLIGGKSFGISAAAKTEVDLDKDAEADSEFRTHNYFLPRLNSSFKQDTFDCLAEYKVTIESITNNTTWNTLKELVITRLKKH